MHDLGKIYVLSFTFENKIGNLHKIRLFTFISNLFFISYNEWDISYTSNLRIYQRIGKNMFSAGKNWILNTLGILCIPQNFFALGKVINIYINYLMFYPSRQHAKWKHFKYTSLHSTMISWCRRFQVLSCWRFFPCQWSYRYMMKMYCRSITILRYTSQSRKFEKFINIHLNKKTLRRSSITHFKM